jgi:hypothetical protein
MNYAKPLLLVASLTLAACNSAPGEVDEKTETTQQSAVLANAILANAILANAILANAILANAILANDLSSEAILANSLLPGALEDPAARQFLQYTVSCALSPSQSVTFQVDGTTYTYAGELGLEPQWGVPGGSCGTTCQRWVSACLLARVDYTGTKRDISMRGEHPALAVSTAEERAYTVPEAAYFGNIFLKNQQRFACLAPGQSQDERVCGPSIEGCVVDIDASCDQVCGKPTRDGAYKQCRPEDGDRDDQPYHETITVYLQPGEP